MSMYVIAGLVVFAVLYKALHFVNKHDGAPKVYKPLSVVLLPFSMLLFFSGAIITIVLVFIMHITGTIREYGKSRFA
jgi:hypothetical protein